MIDTRKLKADLKLDEGIRQYPYTDTVGKITIGVGRNLTDVGISDEEIETLLDSDIDVAIANLKLHLPWISEHPEPVIRALCNMVFNMGINTFLEFQNSIALVKEKKYPEAADNFLKSKWAKQVGPRAKRVTDLIRHAT